MESGTFTFKHIEKILQDKRSRKEQLGELSGILLKNFKTQVYFCQIFGARWSFFAGDKTLDFPAHRIKINENFGMMCGEIGCSEEEWNDVLHVLCEGLVQ